MYKQNPKSPVLKALKGNQGKLPQHLQDAIKAAPESPAKQTTAGEFAHKQSLKDKEMGRSTKVVDKFTSALEAPFSDKTYDELKKEKRAKQKAKYDAKSPAKQTLNAKPPRPKMQKKLRKRDPNKFTETYNAATGSYNDPSYHFKKAELYEKNAIKRYGSLEESRKAYGAGETPAKNYKKGYYGV